MKHSNHLPELCHNGIKLSLLQKRSISLSWIEQAQRSTGRNNPDNQYYNYSVSSTSFSTCTYSVNSEKPAKNYETLHELDFLRKSSGRATKKLAKGTVSRFLLRKITYGMLLLLSIM